MGNKPAAGDTKSGKGLKPVKTYKKANKIRTLEVRFFHSHKIVDKQAFESLRQDWAKVKGVPESSIDFKNTNVNLQEFKALMNPEMRVQDVEALFNLYDCDHNGTITWEEYIVVITLIMAGTTKEKIKLIFNCFDDDQNGSLSKDEFITAAIRFSPNNDNPEATKAFAAKIFASPFFPSRTLFSSSPEEQKIFPTKKRKQKETLSFLLMCDKNGDGSVSYKEFTAWVTDNPLEFEKFAGVLNILHEQG